MPTVLALTRWSRTFSHVVRVGFLLQHSSQDRNGFEVFFEQCLEALKQNSDSPPWVFMRGDGVYQAVDGQRLDEPGFTVPVSGGWKALRVHGVEVYVSQRCASLRGLNKDGVFLPGSRLVSLEVFAELCLKSSKVVVI